MRPITTILLLFILCGQVHSQESRLPLRGLDTDFSTEFPESLASIDLIDTTKAEAYGEFIEYLFKKSGRKVLVSGPPTYYEHIILNDSGLYHNIIRKAPDLDSLGVSSATLHLCLDNDVIFYGHIIDINERNPECLFFLTNLRIVVESVYWSTLDIRPNDTLNAVTWFHGYTSANCQRNAPLSNEPPRSSSSYKTSSHTQHFELGQRDVFVLDKAYYTRILAQNEKQEYYQDPYYTGRFAIPATTTSARLAAQKEAHIIQTFVRTQGIR
ncbi:MAG: hypothetical protein R2813_03240 [Flavobacteriales bacterium]